MRAEHTVTFLIYVSSWNTGYFRSDSGCDDPKYPLLVVRSDYSNGLELKINVLDRKYDVDQ